MTIAPVRGRLLVPVAIVALTLSTSAAASTPAPESIDSDHDGITDATERELGFDPHHVDIPEPLLFDMVRGLGARKGELEANVLAYGALGSFPALRGGPELEWVFEKGYGFEVELPVSTTFGVEACKAAVQGTLPAGGATAFSHGWLAMGEYLFGGPGGRGTATYIAAVRFDARWSALAMIGGSVTHHRRRSPRPRAAGVFNPSVFFDASAYVTLGVELNSILEDDGTTDLVVLPQVHWQPNRSWKIQLGSGAQIDDLGMNLFSALRVSFMY